MPIPVIAIFDIGKTNKKLFLFDEQYKIVFEQTGSISERVDEDGFPCEDIQALSQWMLQSFETLCHNELFDIRALNFSAYGASFVYLQADGSMAAPLYNYLKPYPPDLQEGLYQKYGGIDLMARETASPVLGSLNSGMQLYRIKEQNPELFARIQVALHLPQYLSYLFTGKAYTDLTSLGCHTGLWNFTADQYHSWVSQEGLMPKLAPLTDSNSSWRITKGAQSFQIGVGLHDSSAALIPYLLQFEDPFLLISTGTWCISLNPFNHQPLTDSELQQDCLSYLSYRGTPVKASRLFAGHFHEEGVKKIAIHFLKPEDYYHSVRLDLTLLSKINPHLPFSQMNLSEFESYEEAYHQLLMEIVQLQFHSTRLVLEGTSVKRILVDGGFSKNEIYMHLLEKAFPEMEVQASSVAEGTALGAALAIHSHWNRHPLPTDLISFRH